VKLTLKSFKIKNLEFKNLNGFLSFLIPLLYNMFYVLGYLAIIRGIKIAGGTAAFLYTGVTRVDGFS
jgi:hypothetical protein